MKLIWAITRREVNSCFNSPVAYIVLGVFLLMSGYLFFSTLFVGGFASMRGFFSIAPALFVVFGPALSMRLIAEERKSGTIEQLLTLPIHDAQVVIGKWLAALFVVIVGLLFSLPYVISVALLSAPGTSIDFGTVLCGYIGVTLLAGSFLAIGMLASSLTRNQIIAFIMGLLLCFFFYFIDKFAFLLPASLANILEFLSVDYHFANIARGVIDSRDLVFYFSIIFFGLALTLLTLRRERAM